MAKKKVNSVMGRRLAAGWFVNNRLASLYERGVLVAEQTYNNCIQERFIELEANVVQRIEEKLDDAERRSPGPLDGFRITQIVRREIAPPPRYDDWE